MTPKDPGWHFDNSFTQLPANFYTKISPTPVKQPRVIIVNYFLGQELGLNLQLLSQKQLAELFSGNILPKGAEPISQAYAGHQFGQFTYLGDGRAHLIGEHLTENGRRFDIFLKGSGQTIYGQRGDGRAALEPMLREYLISEAMYALNIPSTRSLAVVSTGEQVFRETALEGAILTRVASSHIRIGTFEYLAAKNDLSGLKKLADYVIKRHYPKALSSKEPYLDLLKAVIEKQVNLIVNWMRVGFIHGVMNTDNTAISGETIDYGPCAFMDNYHPETVFSSIDYSGRYSYNNQPIIAQWNLARFAETLLPLLHKDMAIAVNLATEAINEFHVLYQDKWLAMMRSKLGLFGEEESDLNLCRDLLNWMSSQAADYTNTFRDLCSKDKLTTLNSSSFHNWYDRWQLRLKQNHESEEDSRQLMLHNNPAVIPRNHRVQQALTAASNGDFNEFKSLLEMLQTPYLENLKHEAFLSPPTPQERITQTFCGT